MTDCEGDYEGSVPRHPYIGIYKNPATKDTIVVKIQPVPDDNGIMSKDRLEVHYFTVSNNEEQRRQWSKMIENELGRQGFSVGTFSDIKGYENCSSDQIQMTNIDWVRQKQVSI
jgi:pimeloyl-CoA synthetase